MVQRPVLLGLVSICAMMIAANLALSQAQDSKDTLNQYITDLQKKPDAIDPALLEKIIKLAQEMTPPPAIPAEAVKFADRGEYAAKTAKTESDFADAAEEYKKAMLIAPWWAGYWFNIGVLREKANQPQRAASGLKIYLLAEPNAKDAREVQKRIAGLEYAAEKTAKQPSPEAVAAQEQKKSDDWLKKIDGRRYTSPGLLGAILVIDVRGKFLVPGLFDRDGKF